MGDWLASYKGVSRRSPREYLFMEFSKNYGARLAGFAKIVASLGATGEVLRVKLVYALSREVCSSSGSHFRAREPAAGSSREAPGRAGRRGCGWSPELSSKLHTIILSTFEGLSHLERPDQLLF